MKKCISFIREIRILETKSSVVIYRSQK